MARTASSLESASVTLAISPHMARLTALRTLGRLKTTVAIPPSRSTRISSLIPLLLVLIMGAHRGGPRGRSSWIHQTTLGPPVPDPRRPYRNRSHGPVPELRRGDASRLSSLSVSAKDLGVILYLL